MDERLAALEAEVLHYRAARGAVVAGAAILPDGRYGVTLTILPGADNYPLDDLFIDDDGRWFLRGGGNEGGWQWTLLDDAAGTGVLRFSGEAPDGAVAAWVAYEGSEQRVPIREGHFFFVAWNTEFAEDPRLVRFE